MALGTDHLFVCPLVDKRCNNGALADRSSWADYVFLVGSAFKALSLLSVLVD